MKLPEGVAIAYVIFTNEGRTEYLRAWPGILGGFPAWTLERASREDAAATWGPPRQRPDVLRGDLDDLFRLALGEGYAFAEYEVSNQERQPA